MLKALKLKFNLQRFFVGDGAQAAPYKLTHRRVYILPTKHGYMFAIMLFVMLLGSINYSNSLGYILTFLLASLSVVTIFHTYNNLLKLSVSAVTCAPGFAASEHFFTAQITNSNLQSRYSVTTFTPQKTKSISDIAAQSISYLTVRHRFDQRGLVSVPRFTIESRFPFGLFRAWAIVQIQQRLLIYPKPSSHTQLPIKSTGDFDGHKQVDVGTDDFKSLRAYNEGDPIQHIHWKSFARHQTLQTKEFSTLSSEEFWLNWRDTSVSGTEQKLSQLTRWLLLADNANLFYGLRLPNIEIPASSGKSHLNRCLKELALFH